MLSLVSCIIPVHNGETFIRETIESVLNQTHSCLEIIVADDGSTDGTAAIVKQFEERIKYYHQPNAGPGQARNLGLKNASGEWIAFLDSDDLWHPQKIELQLQYFKEKPGMDLCFTHVRNFSEKISDGFNFSENSSKSMPPFILSSFVGKKSAIGKVGGFDPKLFRGEDGDFFCRLQKAALSYDVLPKILTYHRIHGRSLTRGVDLVQKEILFSKAKSALLKAKSEKTKTSSETKAIFRTLHRSFEAAVPKDSKTEDRFYSLAGRTLKLCFANLSLESYITSSLDHLKTGSDSNPSLTVYIWDSQTTGSRWPAIELSSAPIRRYKNDAGLHIWSVPEIVCAFNQNERTAFYGVRAPAAFPHNEIASPLHRILSWWGRAEGLKLIHAGAVGTKKAAVLLVGKGGSGKSSTALACLNSDLYFAGDDYCFVRTMPPFYVYSTYSSGKLHAADYSKYPYLQTSENKIGGSEAEKKIFSLNTNFAHKILPAIPIRAIFIPVIHHASGTVLMPASVKEALIALAPSTLHQLPGCGNEDFQDLVHLVKSFPSYKLKIGTDRSKIAQAIADFLLAENP